MTILRRKTGIDKKAFTIVELIVVVIIIAIAALLAAPMVSSAADMQGRSAANMIAADIDYAKSMAISTQQNYAVVFDAANESYKLQVLDAVGVGTDIDHPHKAGTPFIVDFANDSRLNRVDIVSADFDSQSTVTFDYLGSPYSGPGTTSALNSGQISLQAEDFSITVNVEPVTGYVTIQ